MVLLYEVVSKLALENMNALNFQYEYIALKDSLFVSFLAETHTSSRVYQKITPDSLYILMNHLFNLPALFERKRGI